MSDNIKVVIRVRPLIEREQQNNQAANWLVEKKSEIRLISKSALNQPTFIYDRVFDSTSSNLEVYEESVQPIVKCAMQGFNGTIFAFGQTSSGKTYTIMGSEQNWGIIPYSIAEIFETIENTPNRLFLLRVSYMEIYNEVVMDLLSGQTKLKIHENVNGDVYVGDLSEEIVRDPSMIFELIEKGEARRHVGETNMNDRSSRSHTIFRIIIESREINNADMDGGGTPGGDQQPENIVTVSHLNIVDLAGSERVSQTGATGDRFKEGCSINKSLFTLAHVISKLSEAGNTLSTMGTSSSGAEMPYVNFRDSKLTRILQNSLGGNSKTAIICTVTPAVIEETLSTLKFASRAKVIKNKPVKNEVGSDEAMLRRYQKQINELKKQINELSHSSNVHALQIEKDNLSKQLDEKEEKISQLMRLICISSKIVLSPRSRENKTQMRNRRITWCPGSRNSLAPASFSPYPFKRPAQLETIKERDSFIAVDRETLKHELEVAERQKCLEFCSDSAIAVNSERNFDMKPVHLMIPFKDLPPLIVTCDGSTQTEIEAKIDKNDQLSQTETVQKSDQLAQTVEIELNDQGFQTENEKTDQYTDTSDIPVVTSGKNTTENNVENISLRQEIDRLRQEHVTKEASIQCYVEELKTLRSEITFLIDLNEQLASENERLLSASKCTSNNHEETIRFCDQETKLLNEQLGKELEILKTDLSKSNEKVEKMSKELTEANEQCEELFMQNWDLNKKLGTLTHQMKQQETVIETCQDENKRLTARCTELESLENEIQQLKVEKPDDTSQLQTENESLKSNLDKLFNDLHESKMKLAYFQSKNSTIEDSWRRKVAKLEQILREKEDEASKLKLRLRQATEEANSQVNNKVKNQKDDVSSTASGTLCRGSGIVEDYKVYMLDAKVYQLEKKLAKTQNELEEANKQKNEFQEKLKLLESRPTVVAENAVHKNTGSETVRKTNAEVLEDKENVRPQLATPVVPVHKRAIFMSPTPERSRREMTERCKQQ